MTSIAQARETIGKNPDSYKRFENYDTRRPAKKAWGEVLEQFLRSRGPSLPLTRSLPTRATSPFASGAAALALFSAYATEHALTRRWNDLEPGRGGQGA